MVGSYACFLKSLTLRRDDIVKWDLPETAKGGPFQDILDGLFVNLCVCHTDETLPHTVDIFVNCIYLSSSIPPFITYETINAAGSKRRLSVIADVSCDTTNPFNPIPVYNVMTTFDAPTVEVEVR